MRESYLTRMSVPFIVLAGISLAAIALSFTRRWGRSRWPFHVIIATALASLALGGIREATDEAHALEWLALTLAAFAGVRALVATFQEPGPRF